MLKLVGIPTNPQAALKEANMQTTTSTPRQTSAPTIDIDRDLVGGQSTFDHAGDSGLVSDAGSDSNNAGVIGTDQA